MTMPTTFAGLALEPSLRAGLDALGYTTLTPIQRGDVHIFGLDARRDTMDIRYNLGYVPQQLSIEPALTGKQNVE